MPRFVFSSFFVGLATSVVAVNAVSEKILDRATLFSPKPTNQDDLIQAYYQQVFLLRQLIFTLMLENFDV